jgi:hypothetical protein
VEQLGMELGMMEQVGKEEEEEEEEEGCPSVV